MKFKVSAELEGESHLIHGINYTIFTKRFEIEVPEEVIVNRAFSVPNHLFEIMHNGMNLKVDAHHEGRLMASGKIGRSQCSERTFNRLKELGWMFNERAAEKLSLPPKTGPLDDTFLWERLTA